MNFNCTLYYNLFFPFYAKLFLLLAFFCIFSTKTFAQNTTTPNSTFEQQLENLTENNDDIETEDDTQLQQMQYYLKHPLNLNIANENDLIQLHLLNHIQLENFFIYRNLFGKFINIYELQAIPYWDVALLQKLRVYVTASENADILNTIDKRLTGGEHSILARVSQTIEKAKGYLIDSPAMANRYFGSPQKILLRYKYQFKNLLQYGILAEKDAGEQFFKGRQQQGFDFYSAHFFARNMGIIKSLAIGDFTVNLGQGLIQWQSLAFTKSADAINIKRESEILRPYNSAGEINFHRGIGITLQIRKLQATAFISYKKIDANLVVDTLSHQDFISSLQTSGYHRTKSETDDKGSQQQLVYGGNLSYQFKKFHIGINAVQYQFKLPLQKSDNPYNLYALSGKYFGNYSIDYNYTYKNFHFFGEAAITNNNYKAFINGVLISASATVDLNFLHRNISQGYQSLYTNAFTENTFPANEKGFYMGVTLRPKLMWRIDAFADFYQFPWLKYRVDAPSNGKDYLLQIFYKPNKQLEIYSRFRSGAKAINYNPSLLTLSPAIFQPKQSWCTQFSYKINQQMMLRNRVEVVWFRQQSNKTEQGFLTYVDFFYSPAFKPFSGNLRLQYFETNSYNSRLYAYEDDVLYAYSVPVFYDKGIRYYINANYDITKKLTFWVRWAQTIYTSKTVISSGLDEIKGNKKSEVKLQMVYSF